MSAFDVAAALNFPKLPEYIKSVEQKLAGILPADNPYIDEPIARLLQAGGKRLRPSLALAIMASQAKTIDEKTIASCAAIECVHLASLVHDDIIDHAESRHGRATINRREGVNRAIIVGDYLLARALEQAAIASPAIAQTIAAAFAAMCDGQARELADIGNLDRTQASYFRAIAGKSAALFAAACEIGALCAELPADQAKAFAHFGHDFGIAYQLADDVLDFIAAPEAFGKSVGTDVREGNYTLPILLALAGPHGQKLRILLKDRLGASAVTDILIQAGTILATISMAKDHGNSAARTLKNFDNVSTHSLKNLPSAYLAWTFKHTTAPERQTLIS